MEKDNQRCHSILVFQGLKRKVIWIWYDIRMGVWLNFGSEPFWKWFEILFKIKNRWLPETLYKLIKDIYYNQAYLWKLWCKAHVEWQKKLHSKKSLLFFKIDDDNILTPSWWPPTCLPLWYSYSGKIQCSNSGLCPPAPALHQGCVLGPL